MQPVVIGIVFKRVAGEIKILTQMRLVQNKAYDPLYDRTWEAVGETIEKDEKGNPTETVFQAVIRGVREECGKPDIRLELLGVFGAGLKMLNLGDIYRTSYSTTGKGDNVYSIEPFDFVQQMGQPQPWFGPVFLVKVAEDFEPDHTKSDGEAGEPKWWSPRDLLAAIDSEPHKFMGLHMPALKKAAMFFLHN